MLRLESYWGQWAGFTETVRGVMPVDPEWSMWDIGDVVRCEDCGVESEFGRLWLGLVRVPGGETAEPFIYCLTDGCIGNLIDLRRVVAR